MKHILGRLLYLSNANPHIKSGFYSLKTKILKEYGVFDGIDLQHIQKKCWNCEDGICGRCTDGIYQEFYCILERYILGDYTFHNPIDRYYKRPDIYGYKNFIYGYIRHEGVSEELSWNSLAWLTFFFDREMLMEMIYEDGWRLRIASNPFLNVSRIYYILIKRPKQYIQYIIIPKIVQFRQSMCKHEYNMEAWECSKCKQTHPDFDIPF